MKRNNYLGKSFGPVGSPAGVIVFVVGVFATFNSIFSLVLVIIGAFFGFTSTSCIIDSHQKRVMFSNNLFGIIPTGKWVRIEPDMRIGIKRSNQVWRSYSQSNRSLDIEKSDFRIILYNSNDLEIMSLKKTKTHESAQAEMDILVSRLGLKPI